MGKLIVEKDRHMRQDYANGMPFLEAHRYYIDWFLKQEWNNEDNIFFSLGDFFHKPYPEPAVYDEAMRWLSGCKFKKIYILIGNHDFKRSLNAYSVDPFQNDPRVEIIYEPQKIDFGKVSALCMPHIFRTKENELSMDAYYSQFIESYEGEQDYLFYHFEDETASFSGKGIDLTSLSGKRCGGHIHTVNNQNYYLNMPVNSRFDERGQDNSLMMLDMETKEETEISVPKTIDYYVVNYPDPLPEVDAQFPIWDFENCNLKKKELYEMYGRIPIRKVKGTLEKTNSEKYENKMEEKKSWPELLDEFGQEKKLSDFLLSNLKQVFTHRAS